VTRSSRRRGPDRRGRRGSTPRGGGAGGGAYDTAKRRVIAEESDSDGAMSARSHRRNEYQFDHDRLVTANGGRGAGPSRRGSARG